MKRHAEPLTQSAIGGGAPPPVMAIPLPKRRAVEALTGSGGGGGGGGTPSPSVASTVVTSATAATSSVSGGTSTHVRPTATSSASSSSASSASSASGGAVPPSAVVVGAPAAGAAALRTRVVQVATRPPPPPSQADMPPPPPRVPLPRVTQQPPPPSRRAQPPPRHDMDDDTSTAASGVSDTISARLAGAEAMYDAARGAHVSAEDREALRRYCTAAAEAMRIREAYAERVGGLKKVGEAARYALTKWLQREELEVVALPPTVERALTAALLAARAEDAHALSASLPTFVCLERRRQRTITDERVLEAAEAVDVPHMLACLTEAPHLQTPLDAFIAATLRGVHERTRSPEFSVKLVKELPPGGPKASDVVELDLQPGGGGGGGGGGGEYVCDLEAGERVALQIYDTRTQSGGRAGERPQQQQQQQQQQQRALPPNVLESDTEVANLVCAVHVAYTRLAELKERIKSETAAACEVMREAEAVARAAVEAQREAELAAVATPDTLRGGGGDEEYDDEEEEEEGGEFGDAAEGAPPSLAAAARGQRARRHAAAAGAGGGGDVTATALTSASGATSAALRRPTLEIRLGAEIGGSIRLRLEPEPPHMSYKRLVRFMLVAAAQAQGSLDTLDPADLEAPRIAMRNGKFCKPSSVSKTRGGGSAAAAAAAAVAASGMSGSVLTASGHAEFMAPPPSRRGRGRGRGRGGSTRGGGAPRDKTADDEEEVDTPRVSEAALRELNKDAILDCLRIILKTCAKGEPPEDDDGRASGMFNLLEGGGGGGGGGGGDGDEGGEDAASGDEGTACARPPVRRGPGSVVSTSSGAHAMLRGPPRKPRLVVKFIIPTPATLAPAAGTGARGGGGM